LLLTVATNGWVNILDMRSITIQEIPEELRAQLEREAKAHFRSLEQELVARVLRSFELEDRLSGGTVNRLIDEAMESGPEEALTRERFDAARQRARDAFAKKRQAA
jgi:hypothetical protein